MISRANLPYPPRGNDISGKYTLSLAGGRVFFVGAIKFRAVNQDSAAGSRSLVSAVILRSREPAAAV